MKKDYAWYCSSCGGIFSHDMHKCTICGYDEELGIYFVDGKWRDEE